MLRDREERSCSRATIQTPAFSISSGSMSVDEADATKATAHTQPAVHCRTNGYPRNELREAGEMPSAGFEVGARDTLGLSTMLSIGSCGGVWRQLIFPLNDNHNSR